MKEEFISCLWKNCLINQEGLTTHEGDPVHIHHPGYVNHDAGPDFFASRIKIDDTLWVGNTEIHVRSSDWYRHKHHLDPAYDNIILHVVYEHDQLVCNSKGKSIPTTEVKNHFQRQLLDNYLALTAARSWIPCQHKLAEADGFILRNWLARLLVERWERKMPEMLQYFHYFASNWERTFYFLLARNFGLKVNATPFGMLMQKTPLGILLKNRDQLPVIEAILFGQAGLLSDTCSDEYQAKLQTEYYYQQKLYKLQPISGSLWKFCRMRPVNFPTIRIAQFAALIHQHEKLFDRMIHAENTSSLFKLMRVKASDYWDSHYRFGKTTKASAKIMGEDAMENIIINTIAPVMFLYGKESLKPDMAEKAVDWMQALPPEKNQIIRNWQSLGLSPQNAAESQALIELKKCYCTPRRCLSCQIGYQVIMH